MTHKHIVVAEDIWQRIKNRAKPHQAAAGVLIELLDLADKYAPITPPAPVVKEPPQEYKTEEQKE